jgi:hypothetical protein
MKAKKPARSIDTVLNHKRLIVLPNTALSHVIGGVTVVNAITGKQKTNSIVDQDSSDNTPAK